MIACVDMSTLSEVFMNMAVKQALIILWFCKIIPFKLKKEKNYAFGYCTVGENVPRGLTAWKERSNLYVSGQQLAVKQP